ncbi:MAG: hypothetical protein RR232_03355 [Clostridia bacterium]
MVNKKTLSVLLALIMVLMVFPAVALASTGVATASDFAAAFATATDMGDGTVKLNGDQTLAGGIELTLSEAVTLDLNGHTLTVDNNANFLMLNGGSALSIVDSAGKGRIVSSIDTQCIQLKSGATLNIKSGAISSSAQSAILSSGTLNITGGSITGGAASAAITVQAGVTTVSGGSISGHNGISATGGALTLTGVGGNIVTIAGDAKGNALDLAGGVSASVSADTAVTAYNGKVFAASSTITGNVPVKLTITTAAQAPAVPVFTTTSLPGGTLRKAYNQGIAVSGAPNTWSISSGALPAGLSLGNTGIISGTPTASGTYTFSVRAANDNAYAEQQLTIRISGGGSIPPTPDYDHIATNKDGSIRASGDFEKGSSLVTKRLTSGTVYNALYKLRDGKSVLCVYDISLSPSQKYTGKADVTFFFGAKYANKVMTVMHRTANGSVEFLHATTGSGGDLTVTANGLSPFMVVLGNANSGSITIPNTGDAASVLGIVLILSAVTMAAVTLKKRVK